MEYNSSRRVSYEQMKLLMDFMGQHVEFAKGEHRTTEARSMSKELWKELAKNVNGVGGTKKTPDMWSRYWSDFKNKLKKRVKVLNSQKRQGTIDKSTKPLTKLERRALVILGPKFAKMSNRTANDSGNTYSKHLPAKVKVECHDNGQFYKEHSDDSDRESDGERDDTSIESSGDENGPVTEQSISETSLHNIYPKWLIEVEKKKAEADLIRARAEEQRVTVARKSAEAALLQAEALKKLSEAASIQADALMKIAKMMENRNNQHLLPI